MNKLIFLTLIFSTFMLLGACKDKSKDGRELSNHESIEEIKYDSLKATRYGADDYGMKKYIFAYLKKGPNRDQPQDEAQALQMAHQKNISRMAEEGKLVLAGPFLDDGDIRGIYIFNVETIEEAKELTNSDPAIKAGRLQMELVEWYGSAALIEVNAIHQTLSKQSFTNG